jgi:hypothetical protein
MSCDLFCLENKKFQISNTKSFHGMTERISASKCCLAQQHNNKTLTSKRLRGF